MGTLLPARLGELSKAKSSKALMASDINISSATPTKLNNLIRNPLLGSRPETLSNRQSLCPHFRPRSMSCDLRGCTHYRTVHVKKEEEQRKARLSAVFVQRRMQPHGHACFP